MRDDRWRVAAPVALLLSVGLAQIVLTRVTGLSPWKGGGFGMFAATDGGSVRSLRIVVEGPDRSEHLDVPPSLEVDADRTIAFPVDPMLARLARRVIAREQRQGRVISRVRVEVSSAVLSGDGSSAEARQLAAHVTEVKHGDVQ